MQYSVVIPCAGIGSRMNLGYNKMLYEFNNQETVIQKTVNIFIEDDLCQQVILVINESDQEIIQSMLSHPKIEYAKGGQTRQESVYHGLKKVNQDYVLIHDGARCYLSKKSISLLLKQLKTTQACLLMVPVKDTVKEVKDGIVVKTLYREALMLAQTPQAFKTKTVRLAHDLAYKNSYIGTDDCDLVERFTNEKVYVVEGDYKNIKITTIEDIKQ